MANTVQLLDPYWWRLQPAADLFTARALFLPSVDYCTQCKQSRGRNRASADLESQMSKVSDNDMISHCGKIGTKKSTYQPQQWRHCSSSCGMQLCMVLPISNFSCLRSCLSEFVNNFDFFSHFWVCAPLTRNANFPRQLFEPSLKIGVLELLSLPS